MSIFLKNVTVLRDFCVDNVFNWLFAKTRSLRYCNIWQAIPLSCHTSCSHAVKNTSLSKEATDNTERQDIAGYFRYKISAFKFWHFFEIQTINNVLWLLNVLRLSSNSISTDHLFLFTIVIEWNKHEWTSEEILFQPRKDINTHYFSSLNSTLLFGLFVGQNGRFGVMIGQIICQSNSLEGSIINIIMSRIWPEHLRCLERLIS